MFYNPKLVLFSVASFYLLFFSFFSFSAKHFATLFKKGLKCARDKSSLIRHISIIIYYTIMHKYTKTIEHRTVQLCFYREVMLCVSGHMHIGFKDTD